MKYPFLLLLSFFAIGGCSSDDDIPTPESPATTGQAAPEKISDDNPFATQVNALDTAKMVGDAAQKAIDDSQQKLDEASH